MKILILVESRIGEESMWVSDITEEEMSKLEPLLYEIQKRNGYYPTGSYYTSPDPKPEELYKYFDGFEILRTRLPTPINGFGKIREVTVMTGDSYSLYM
jgi:hypothetical protein